MYLVVLGVIGLLLKYLEIGFVANLSWLWVLAPFGLAVVWWWWADSSGYTKRKAMEREDERKKARIEKQRAAIGLGSGPGKRK